METGLLWTNPPLNLLLPKPLFMNQPSPHPSLVFTPPWEPTLTPPFSRLHPSLGTNPHPTLLSPSPLPGNQPSPHPSLAFTPPWEPTLTPPFSRLHPSLGTNPHPTLLSPSPLPGNQPSSHPSLAFTPPWEPTLTPPFSRLGNFTPPWEPTLPPPFSRLHPSLGTNPHPTLLSPSPLPGNQPSPHPSLAFTPPWEPTLTPPFSHLRPSLGTNPHPTLLSPSPLPGNQPSPHPSLAFTPPWEPTLTPPFSRLHPSLGTNPHPTLLSPSPLPGNQPSPHPSLTFTPPCVLSDKYLWLLLYAHLSCAVLFSGHKLMLQCSRRTHMFTSLQHFLLNLVCQTWVITIALVTLSQWGFMLNAGNCLSCLEAFCHLRGFIVFLGGVLSLPCAFFDWKFAREICNLKGTKGCGLHIQNIIFHKSLVPSDK